jgi:RNA recognition motif-containing protein
MARLWIINVPAELDEDELAAFLGKFGLPRFEELLSVPGDGSRPAVALSYPGLNEEALRRFQPRVNGVQWKDRRLSVQVVPPGLGSDK